MAKALLLVDTTEANEKLEELNIKINEVAFAMKILTRAAQDASLAMQKCKDVMEDFGELDIKIEQNR